MTTTPLWLVDRSRYEAEHAHCDRHRYLEYHSGPTGYGIRRSAQSLYATTGIYLHNVAEGITRLQRDTDWTVPVLPTKRTEVRKIILAAVARYYRLIEKRGFQVGKVVEGKKDIQQWVTEEQATLIEGLGWAFAYDLLPWFTKQFTPVTIEREEFAVIACTCGLGDLVGTQEEHESRNCAGIGWMSRADLVLRRNSDKELGWHDYKTSADPFKPAFDESWKENVQFAAGVLGAERALGEPITHYYIHGFSKGKRANFDISKLLRHLEPKTMTKLQGSPMCYAYLKEADPPTTPVDDWQPRYEWWERDELTGQNRKRRLGKGYNKREIWREGNFPNKLPEQSNVEYWMEWSRANSADLDVDENSGSGLIHTVGPYGRPDRLIEAFMREMPSAERRWQEKLWNIYDAKHEVAGRSETPMSDAELAYQPEVQLAVDENFPRNWSGCQTYFGDKCAFHPICHYDSGWDMPETIGFIGRRPHHDPERFQMELRGLPVPEDEDAEDGYAGESS